MIVIKKGNIIAFCLFVITICIQTCKPDPCESVPDQYVHTYNNSNEVIPYSKNSILTFFNISTKDTLHFYFQKIDTSFWYYRDYSATCEGGSFLQQRGYFFNSPEFENPLSVSIIFTQPLSDYLEIILDKNMYYIRPIRIGRSNSDFDSILIQNNWYYDVQYFKNEYNTQPGNNFGCYYNKSFGVLKMETTDGIMELVRVTL